MTHYKHFWMLLVANAMCLLMISVVGAQYSQVGNKLVGTGSVSLTYQGVSVSLSADSNTAIVGGLYDNGGVGAAWVYVRTGGVWTQQGEKLVGTGAVGYANQGQSVSISADGNTALVGGPQDNGGAGAAWVFTRAAGVWTQEGDKLVGSGAGAMANQGTSVSLSADGNTAIIGGPGFLGGIGAAWVFIRTAGVWEQEGQKLTSSGAVGNAMHGASVSLSADGNTAIVGGSSDAGGLGAVWIYTRTAGNWTHQGAKLVGTGAVGNAAQGTSVSLSADGNTAIVGGIGDNDYAGAAWVYVRAAGVWAQQGGKLVGTGAAGYANQGNSVSLSADGNTAIVGGSWDSSQVGAAWIFTRTGGVWIQQGGKLVGTGVAGSPCQGFSSCLSADGNTAIVGGPSLYGGLGAAWIFVRSGSVWTQQGDILVGTDAVGSVTQGSSVSLSADGNTAIMGGVRDNDFAGAAWVYTLTDNVWTQQGAKLTGTGSVGSAVQGSSVSLSADGNTAIVGGPGDSVAGAAWVYTRTSGVWSQQGDKLVGTGALGYAKQGNSVSLSADGNTVIVGGPGDNNYAGAAWVFIRTGGVWTQQGGKLVGTGVVGTAQQGWSVSLSADGNTAIVGGPGDNNYAGAAWIFIRAAGVWTQQGAKLTGTGAVGNASKGWSVSLSADGNTAVVGGPSDSGSVGATWVYTRTGGVWAQQGAKLVGTGAVGNAFQGYSVSLSADGSTAIVGGSYDSSLVGAAWMYRRIGGVWTQQGAKLVGTGVVGSAQQGRSVSLSADGRTAMVGGPDDNNSVGASWIFTDPRITALYAVNAKWNLISVPLTASDYTKTILYPTAISEAYAFEGSYAAKTVLTNGVGYWMKFGSAQSIPLTGSLRDSATISVGEGWNLVGSISTPVNVMSVISDPPGIVTSEFFGYSGSYTTSVSIEPGKAYWVKVNQAGALKLTSSSSLPANRIRIVPTSELPPSPPDAERSYASATMPAEFSLHQNYPNPFNPSTVVRYDIPDNGGAVHVQLRVYDVLGQLVVTLVDGLQEPGYRSVSWNASNVPTGIFFYRINAGSFSEIRKMLLLR